MGRVLQTPRSGRLTDIRQSECVELETNRLGDLNYTTGLLACVRHTLQPEKDRQKRRLSQGLV